MDNIRWKVTDPFGKKIILSEKNFRDHIIGRHDTKDARVRAEIEPQAKFAIEHPRFIIRDVQYSGRVKYLSLTDIKDADKVYIRTITVVVEESDEIVTWFARRTINDSLEEEDVIFMMPGTTIYRYDTDHDVMYVQLEKYTPEESLHYVDDEVLPSINEVRDVRNEDLVGFVILDYRRNKPELVKRYPEYFF